MTLEVIASTRRGTGDYPVATGPTPSDRRELIAFIKRAVQDGDMLPNASKLEPARRRALIIAPQYREPGQIFEPLPSTAADFGLATNAEISASYVTFVASMVEPTQPGRIFLEWLVTGATEGDYRFLHFSGHGHRVETDSSRGKEGRIVQSDNWLRVPGAWDSELASDAIKAGRVVEQTIAESELVYYNEAIITRISEEIDPELEEEEEHESMGKIWDRELNEFLSKLPQGCTVTCVMDCCASGRILNLSRKLGGSGFRGKSTQAAITNPPSLLIPSVPPTMVNQDNSNAPSTASLITPITSIATIASTMIKIVPRMVRYSRRVMQEGIPEKERCMDGIRARIYAWSACHQRQLSWDANDFSSGLLTQTFTETCIRLSGSADLPTRYTYNILFEEVSKLVAERRSVAANPSPQFVQLWTSLREESRIIETSLLDSHVEF